MREASNKILTIPNAISLFRLLLIPIIIVFYVVYQNYVLSLVFLALSAFSDVLDGFIARKFNMVSQFGRVFDPIVDKLTLVSLLFTLSSTYKIMLLLAIVITVKEVISGIVALVVFSKIKKTINSEWHGKLGTALVYLTIFTHVIFTEIPRAITFVMIGLCVAAIINSLTLYVRRFLKERKLFLEQNKASD